MEIDFTKGEAKEALDKAVAAAVAESEKGLKAKNAELLREKKELEAKFEGIDPDEFKRLKDGVRDDSEKSIKDAKELRERWEAEEKPKRDKLKKERDDALEAHRKDRIERGVNDALMAANVSKDLMPAAKALLLSSRKVDVGDDGVIIDGKSASAFATEWAAGDGKAFVGARDNSGGGAKGGAGGGAAGEKKTSEMSRAEKVAYIKEHGSDAWSQKIKES